MYVYIYYMFLPNPTPKLHSAEVDPPAVSHEGFGRFHRRIAQAFAVPGDGQRPKERPLRWGWSPQDVGAYSLT